jgi:hypothetical protein
MFLFYFLSLLVLLLPSPEPEHFTGIFFPFYRVDILKKDKSRQIRIGRFACLRSGTKATPLLWNNEGWSYRDHFL